MDSDKDIEFLKRVKQHPKLYERMKSILDVAEAKGDNPDTADAVEARVVEEVRQMGADVIGEWAKDKSIREAIKKRSSEPDVRSYKKK